MDHLFIGGIGVAPAQVVLDGAGEEDVLLQHHGHGVAQRFKVVLAHVHAADQHAALGDIVEAGDELHQRRFGRARAAEYAHHLAGLDVEVSPAQAEALRVAGIAEIDVFKADGAVLDFLDGVFRVLDVRHFLQHLGDALLRSLGDGEHDKDHGDHHQAHQNLHGVGNEAHQFARGHANSGVVAGGDDHARAKPGDEQHHRIDAQLHQRHVEGHGLFRLGEVLIDVFGDFAELLVLMLLAHEGLDHTDAAQVFLHHLI